MNVFDTVQLNALCLRVTSQIAECGTTDEENFHEATILLDEVHKLLLATVRGIHALRNARQQPQDEVAELVDVLGRMKHALFESLVTRYRWLSTKHAHRGIEIITSDMVYRLRAMCVYALHVLHSRLQKVNLDVTQLRATQLKACCTALLVVSSNPILEYRASTLMAALRTLEKQWKSVKYHDDIKQYIELLEIRAAQLLCIAHSGRVLDVDMYRTDSGAESEKGKLYIASDKFLEHLTSLLPRMWTAVCVRCIAKHVPYDDHTMQPDGLSRGGLLKWLETLARHEEHLNFRDVIRQRYMSMCLRMSESEQYRREVSNFMYTPDKAMRERRGEASLTGLTNKIDQSCAKLLTINEDEDPLAVFAVAHTLIEYHMQSHKIKWDNFVITERQLGIRYRELRLASAPIIVQTFNFFNIYFGDFILETNSYLHAFVVWLHLVRTRFKSVVEQHDISETVRAITEWSRKASLASYKLYGNDNLSVNELRYVEKTLESRPQQQRQLHEEEEEEDSYDDDMERLFGSSRKKVHAL